VVGYRPVCAVHEGEYRCPVVAVITISSCVLLGCHIVSLSSIVAYAVIAAICTSIDATLTIRVVCWNEHSSGIMADIAVVRSWSPDVPCRSSSAAKTCNAPNGEETFTWHSVQLEGDLYLEG